jgi:chromosome segregation ATPase
MRSGGGVFSRPPHIASGEMMRKGKLKPEVRKKIIIRIGDLIEWHCKACEHNQSNMNLSQIQYCRKHCEIGQELARLGRMLEGKERGEIEMVKFKITKEAYEAMKKEGKTDKFIADYFGVTQATLSYHKKKWEAQDAQVEVKEEKTDSVAEYESLIAELKKQITEYESAIKKLTHANEELRAELNEVVSQRDSLNAACEDVENELAQCKESFVEAARTIQQLQGEKEHAHREISKLKDELVRIDSELQNYKEELEVAVQENERLESQNRKLRKLLEVAIEM